MFVSEISQTIDPVRLAEKHMEEGGLYVYEKDVMTTAATSLLDLRMPFGHTVRFAAKANPNAEVIKHFDGLGLEFDASSVYEADKLVKMGVPGNKISLSSQVLRDNDTLDRVLRADVLPVATSLRQLQMLGGIGITDLAVRINTDIGAGHNPQTDVGGSTSAFGIWHENLGEVKTIARQHGQTINRLHMHVGSGADPNVWQDVIRRGLRVVDALPDVTTFDVGGGYKVARTEEEFKNGYDTDMIAVGDVFAEELGAYADRTGRRIHLEIEPGTYLAAHAGTLLGRVEEIKTTDRYQFLVLNVGMNGLLRPSHYGSQHPMQVINSNAQTTKYVGMGPACESGDLLTPKPNHPGVIMARDFKIASVDDIVAIGSAGAYGLSMASVNYNELPKPAEILV